MAEGVLRLTTAGGPEFLRAIRAAGDEWQSMSDRLTAAARKAAEDRVRIAKWEADEIRRALGGEVTDTVGTERAKTAARSRGHADAMRQSRERRRAEGEEIAEARRELSALADARKKRSRERLREIAEEKKANENAVASRLQTEARAREIQRRLEERAGRARQREREREGRDLERLGELVTRSRERAERAATRAVERESRQRERIAAREAAQVERLAGRRATTTSLWGSIRPDRALRTFGYEYMGQFADARDRSAITQRQLGTALYQAGAGGPEVAQTLSSIRDFASRTGIATDELVAAIGRAQTEFSVLGDRSTGSAERAGRLSAVLQTALLGRNTGNDVGEFVRLDAMLSNMRVGDAMRQTLGLWVSGAAQRGAIEVGSLTREGMQSLIGRMNAAAGALPESATPEQRQSAQAHAFMQAVSEMEVFRGMGPGARMSGNAMQALNTALQSDVVQQRMQHNIRAKFGENSPLERTLFETRNGRASLREQYRDALVLGAEFAQTAGADPTLLQNVFAGGGRGNPQALQANWRRMLGMLVSRDGNGTAAYERVLSLMNVTQTALTADDVARGEGVFGNDPLSQLNRMEEARMRALTDNTTTLNRVATSLDTWRREHPFSSSAALGMAEGLLGGFFASRWSRGPMTILPGGGAGGASGAGPGGIGPLLGGGASRLTVGSMAVAVLGGLSIGLTEGERLNQAIAGRSEFDGLGIGGSRSTDRDGRVLGRDANADWLSGMLALPKEIADAVRDAQIVVRIDPHDAAQVAQQERSQRSTRFGHGNHQLE